MTRSGLARAVGLLATALATVAVASGCVIGAPADSGRPTTSGVSSIPGLPDAALDVMNQPQFANGRWAISVKDIDTGETLIDLDGDRLAEPGSFVKTYSAGAAWLKWGPDHTLVTPVKQSGSVVGGTLTGDLVLVAQGDVTMGGRTKPDGTVDFTDFDHNDANPLPGATLTPEDPLAGLDALAAQVKASGISTVYGDVIVDDRMFAGTLDDKPVSPMVINQNLIDVLITPGAVGEPAGVALTPVVAPWTIDNRVQTVSPGAEMSIADPRVDPGAPRVIVLEGTIAADSGPALKVYEVDDAAAFGRTAFIEALRRAGVAVSADPVAANPVGTLPDRASVDSLTSVAELESLPLAEEVTYVMKISYNRGAQTLICRLAASVGESTCDAGLAVAGGIWADAGLDTLGVSLVDGSGLEGNYITAENAVDVQILMAERADADEWRATMPILGVDGSLASVQTDSAAAGKVFAKTGTLVGRDLVNGRVRLATKTLGGVMDTEKGRRLAFTIIVNQGIYAGIDGVFEANDDVGRVAALIQQAY